MENKLQSNNVPNKLPYLYLILKVHKYIIKTATTKQKEPSLKNWVSPLLSRNSKNVLYYLINVQKWQRKLKINSQADVFQRSTSNPPQLEESFIKLIVLEGKNYLCFFIAYYEINASQSIHSYNIIQFVRKKNQSYMSFSSQPFDLSTKQSVQKQHCYYKKGSWSEKELLQYCLFIWHHRQSIDSQSKRKSLRLFKMMSNYLKTRKSTQCRSFHNKMMENQQSVKSLVEKYALRNYNFFNIYEQKKKQLQLHQDTAFFQDNQYTRKALTTENIIVEVQEQDLVKIEQDQISQSLKRKTPFYLSPFQQKEILLKQCHASFLQWICKFYFLMHTTQF